MATEEQRRAAMYPALMAYAQHVADVLQTKVTLDIDTTMEERLLLGDAREVLHKDAQSKCARNVHVHPVFGPALASMSPALQSDIPAFLMEDRG